MTKRSAIKNSQRVASEQIKVLQARLFKASAELDEGKAVVFDSRGPANPYEKMYDRHGVSPDRRRR
jgi:hypothetical protein